MIAGQAVGWLIGAIIFGACYALGTIAGPPDE